jgi:hypothetical protein
MASEFKNTEAFIRRYGDQVENEIKTRLVNNGRVASGKLFDSIRSEVKETKREFILQFFMDDYGKYIDKGVRGSEQNRAGNSPYKYTTKMPPEKDLRSWMKLRGIPKSASFPIRRSIFLFGIEPTNFFTIPTTRRQKQFEAGIEKNMALDVEEILAKEAKRKP